MDIFLSIALIAQLHYANKIYCANKTEINKQI